VNNRDILYWNLMVCNHYFWRYRNFSNARFFIGHTDTVYICILRSKLYNEVRRISELLV